MTHYTSSRLFQHPGEAVPPSERWKHIIALAWILRSDAGYSPAG
jgi:hypothetical protein